jgi:hypothetical protein
MDAEGAAVGSPTEGDGDEPWHWADELSPAALQSVALVTLGLLREPHRWIHRRVERIYFRDHSSARHQMSVDFTLPADVPPIAELKGEQVYVAPLFMLAKTHPKPLKDETRDIPMAPYSNIDFCGQDGKRLPLLTRRQSGRIAAVTLTECAKQVLKGVAMSDTLGLQIGDIATLDTVYERPGTKAVLEAVAPIGDPRRKLRQDPFFRELAYALSTHSLVVCLFTELRGRSIVKLAYDETTNTSVGTPKGRARRSLGWKSEQYFVALTEIGGCASYHVEIDVPRELELNEVGLVGTRYEDFGRDLSRLTRSRQSYYVRQVGKATTGALYLPSPGGRAIGAAWVKLRARRAGFLVGALVASLITTGVLTLATIAEPDILRAKNPEGAIAVLLLVPTLLAAYVARPGEHAITAKMLRWARLALVLDGILPFVAALLLLTSAEAASVQRMTSPAANKPTVVHRRSHAGRSKARGHHRSTRAGHTSRSRGARQRGYQSQPTPPHTQTSGKAAPRSHTQPLLETLRGKWAVLAAFSLIFVVLFGLSNLLPKPHGKSRYVPGPSAPGGA